MSTETEQKPDEQKPEVEDKKVVDPIEVDETKLDDSARKVLADYRRELKRHRETAESAQKRADELAKAAAEAERKANEASTKLSEKEKAELAEQQKWRELAERNAQEKKDAEAAAEKRMADIEQRYNDELSSRDRALVREAVARAAVKAGIGDEDDIDLPAFAEAFESAKVEKGRVVGADDVVARMKELKPGKFEDKSKREEQREEQRTERQRDESGKFVRPDPSKKPGETDVSKMNESEFEELERRLRRGAA